MARLLFSLLIVPVLMLAQSSEKIEKLAPYYPTPETIVDEMLKLVAVKPGEKMYDLGSGDGRIVIASAKKGANSVGVEFDEDLYKRSSAKIKQLGLEKKASIIWGDMLKQDYSSADVVTVYLLPVSTDKMRPILEKQLKKGARIVAHDFEFAGWNPVKIVTIEDDGEGRSHTLYLYQR